jgi:hypothetical protein
MNASSEFEEIVKWKYMKKKDNCTWQVHKIMQEQNVNNWILLEPRKQFTVSNIDCRNVQTY